MSNIIRKANANEIKKELDNKGIDTRNISIEVDDNNIWVTIKDLTIDRSKVALALNHYESYRTNPATGELLHDGLYVYVQWDSTALHNAIDEFIPKAREFMEQPSAKVVERDDYTVRLAHGEIYFTTPTHRWVRSLELSEQSLARVLAFDSIGNKSEVLGCIVR